VPKPPLLPEIENCLHNWNSNADMLRGLFIALTALSLICTVLVGGSSATAATVSATSSSQVGFLTAWEVAVLSIMAAISVGIMSALDIRGNADRIRRAWRKLNSAVMEYKTEDGFTVEQLNQAYRDAEAIIGVSKE